METFRRALLVAGLLAIAAPGARGQSTPLNPANAKSFLGVWVIEMTEPAVFKGTHTIRIWDNRGTVAASLQTNPNFPAIEATHPQRWQHVGPDPKPPSQAAPNAGEWHAHLGSRVRSSGWRHDESRSDAGTESDHQARDGESPELIESCPRSGVQACQT